jgi:rubrerythrin
MATKENLQEAFAGESQANRKYVAFAKKAKTDGFPNVAKIFRAAAEAETIHALAHLKVMKGVKSTTENLPSFANAMAVEQVHYKLYLDALDSVQEERDVGERTIYVCGVCGNTVLGDPPDSCPVCGSPKKKFFEVE